MLNWLESDELRRLRQGDESAIGSIFDRYADRVKYYVLRQPATRTEELAEEFTQEAFLAFLKRPRWKDSAYRKLPSIGAYLFKVATTCVVHESRRLKAEGAMLQELARLPVVRPPDPESHLIKKEERQVITGAVGGLPEKYQATAELAVLGQCTPAETAKLTGEGHWKVRKRIDKIYELLAKATASYFKGKGDDHHEQ